VNGGLSFVVKVAPDDDSRRIFFDKGLALHDQGGGTVKSSPLRKFNRSPYQKEFPADLTDAAEIRG
jgi:hypothetical protein